MLSLLHDWEHTGGSGHSTKRTQGHEHYFEQTVGCKHGTKDF